MKIFLMLVAAAFLSACGGGGEEDTPPSIDGKFILTMETIAHATEFIYIYDTPGDCIGAGSYRLNTYPGKYMGYTCHGV